MLTRLQLVLVIALLMVTGAGCAQKTRDKVSTEQKWIKELNRYSKKSAKLIAKVGIEKSEERMKEDTEEFRRVVSQALDEVIASLKSEDKDIRHKAVQAFKIAPVKDERVFQALVELLNSEEDEDVRADVALALMETRESQVVPVLAKALVNDSFSNVRLCCGFALYMLGKSKLVNADAIPALIKAMGDESNLVQAVASGTLAEMDTDIVKPALEEALKSENATIRDKAHYLLEEMLDKRQVIDE